MTRLASRPGITPWAQRQQLVPVVMWPGALPGPAAGAEEDHGRGRAAPSGESHGRLVCSCFSA